MLESLSAAVRRWSRRSRFSARSAIGLGIALLAALLMLGALRSPAVTGELPVVNPRFELDDEEFEDTLRYPSVVRYQSELPEFEKRECFGLVVSAERGVPRDVLNLTALDKADDASLLDFADRGGFERAAEVRASGTAGLEEYVERIEKRDLPRRIRPPVDITVDQIEAEERFVIGVGFNYERHREAVERLGAQDARRKDETEEPPRKAQPVLFPKLVEPTGAYEPVENDQVEETSFLLDYEAEIGFVLLQDFDLYDLPSRDEVLARIAFFAANDLTNRWPQIVEGEAAFTRAKSHRNFLPTGPWLVHGSHLNLRTKSGGSRSVGIRLRVDEKQKVFPGAWRQNASSEEMIWGPRMILDAARTGHEKFVGLDKDRLPRRIARVEHGRPIIPRGSIVLTGSPAGTAIEAPSGVDKAKLLVRANLSPPDARTMFARHCVENRKKMGFLSYGDQVETWIRHLGRQYWEIRQRGTPIEVPG